MLLALIEDLLGLPEVRVDTTWDRRLGSFPLLQRPGPSSLAQRGQLAERLRVFQTATPADERAVFDQRCRSADAVLVIAPELDGALLERRKWVDRLGGFFVGPSVEGIELFSDKLQTFRFLEERGLPTVPTFELPPSGPVPRRFPVVVKRREGAGSHECRLVQTEERWEALLSRLQTEMRQDKFVWQPFVEGMALSTSLLVHRDGRVDVFPTGEQRLAQDGTFRYRGGVVPIRLPGQTAAAIERVVYKLCRQAPGPLGLIGIDWLLASRERSKPLIVDVNPRLTTSYVAYRRLAKTNLAGRLLAATLDPHRLPQALRWYETTPLKWEDSPVRFEANGRVLNPTEGAC